MKSKTSCFNLTIFKKNISRYWPVWALFLCYLLLVFPFHIWLNVQKSLFYEGITEAERQIQIIESALRRAIEPTPFFVFAAVAAMMVFSYLYTAKNANMIHALPVDRLELFTTNYISGLLFLLIPEMIAFVAAVMVCLANQITRMEYLFWWFLCAAGVTFFAYSLAVFVAMFTGLLPAMPVYYVIVNYLYVGCLWLIHAVKDYLCYGLMQNTWNPGKSCMLSPLYYLTAHLRVRVVYDGNNMAEGLRISGWKLVPGYAAAAVVFVLLAFWLYRRRQIENAGDFISISAVKPVFRWGVAFCGGIVLALLATEQIRDAIGMADNFPCMLAGTLIFVSICFWLAEMLLQKKCRVFSKKRFAEWAALAVVSVGFLLLFELDVFGLERRVPERGEVEAAFICMDYPLWVREADIPEMLKLHQEIIDHKKEYQDNQASKDGRYYNTTFRYYLKDGSMLERRYALPVTEAYLAEENTPSAKIIAWEKQEDYLKNQILGWDYEHNEYYYGDIQIYSEEGDTTIHHFSKEELTQLLQAVEQDMKEGNFAPYYIHSDRGGKASYLTEICLEYYNKVSEAYSVWDYFENYRQYYTQEEQRGKPRERSVIGVNIIFGEECVHTIRALEKSGILNETWKLYTDEEWQKLLNREK